MRIAINKIHFPVTTLGYGRRVGIWFQGCSIRCPGCINRDTWETTTDHEIDTHELITGCSEWLTLSDGVTISGGEPFDQPDALSVLIEAIRTRSRGDILVYSGYNLERLRQHFPDILNQIDVLISEPYLSSCGDSLVLRGSDNQRVTLLTSLAGRRYPQDIDHVEWSDLRRLDVTTTENEAWLAGIPRKGEMARLKAKLKSLGYRCATSNQATSRE